MPVSQSQILNFKPDFKDFSQDFENRRDHTHTYIKKAYNSFDYSMCGVQLYTETTHEEISLTNIPRSDGKFSKTSWARMCGSVGRVGVLQL